MIKKGEITMWIIIAGFVAAIMVCAGVYLYMDCRDHNDDDRVPREAYRCNSDAIKCNSDYYDKVLKEPHGSD